MELDPHNLTDKKISLKERLHLFNKIIEKYGALDEHILSNILKITPQVIIAFYELNILDDEEIDFLDKRHLDIGIISTLMNIQPEIRKNIYKKLDEYLKEDYPVLCIIDYINEGEWTYKIRDLYNEIDRNFWVEVSSYLKDNDIKSGTITPKFRRMLVSIKKFNASNSQLQWLERGIIYDYEQNIGVFNAKTFQVRFPDAVYSIQKLLESKKKLHKLIR